jgi:hypothetical protein
MANSTLPLTYLDGLGGGGTINIEDSGVPVEPAVDTLDVIGADVVYNPSLEKHELIVTSGGLPTMTGGGKVILTSDGLIAIWGQVSDSYISDVNWSKVTSHPTTINGYGITDAIGTSRTISTTAPLTGGGDLSANRTLAINVVSNVSSGVVPLISNAGLLVSANGTAVTWATAITDTLHGQRGGGNLHSVVSGAAAGFVPGMGTADRVLVTTDGASATWGQISNAMLSGSIAWSKLTGYPTITTASPLTIGGAGSADLSTNRTLAVNAVSNASSGVVPIIPAGNSVLVSAAGTTSAWLAGLTNAYISATAGIAVTKLTLGGANQVLTSNGTVNAWSSISSSMISSVAWSTVTGAPTTLSGYGITDAVPATRSIGTTAPLTGGGNLSSNLTLGISAATTSDAGSMSATDKSKLDALSIGGTLNVVPKFTSAGGIGDSSIKDNATLVTVSKSLQSTGELQSTFATGLRLTQGNYGFMLRNDGSNAFALLTASGDASGSFNALRPLSISNASGDVNIANGSIYAQHATGNVSVGHINAPAYRLDVRGATGNTGIGLWDTGSNYAKWVMYSGSPNSTSGIWYLWNGQRGIIEYLTDTGFHGFGGITDPTANVDTTTLRVRGGSPVAGKMWTCVDSAGNGGWAPLANPTTNKNGTHRAHQYRDKFAFEPQLTATNFDYPESLWKGDEVDPNSATQYTLATVTVRAMWFTSINNKSVEKTTKSLLYKLVGSAWTLDSTTEIERVGAATTEDDLSISLLLVGSNNRTVRVMVQRNQIPSKARDCVIFVDIDGGGNYAS